MNTPRFLTLVALGALALSFGGPLRAQNVFESPLPPQPTGRIDELVFANLARLNVQPVLCSDGVFVRRAYLDVIGTLPTAQEARAFLQDPDTANKRSRLIDRLLERPEFADYWAMKWSDVLRIKAEFPVNLWPNAAQAYHRWVLASVATHKPYDQFARELLTASGSNFRVGPANFYRAMQNRTPEGIATTVALTLMGARAEAWPAARLAGLAPFFSQVGYKPTSEWKEEHVFWDPLGTSTAAGNPRRASGPTACASANSGSRSIHRAIAARRAFASCTPSASSPAWFAAARYCACHARNFSNVSARLAGHSVTSSMAGLVVGNCARQPFQATSALVAFVTRADAEMSAGSAAARRMTGVSSTVVGRKLQTVTSTAASNSQCRERWDVYFMRWRRQCLKAPH